MSGRFEVMLIFKNLVVKTFEQLNTNYYGTTTTRHLAVAH